MAEPFNEIDPVRKTFFIDETERSVDPADDAGFVPQLGLDGFISTDFIRYARRHSLYAALDGSTTPKAVKVNSAGVIVPSDANTTVRNRFLGFIKENIAVHSTLPTFLNSSYFLFTTTAVQRTYTANAGNNRAIVLTIFHSATNTLPTSVTWNGISFSKIEGISWEGGNQLADVWIAAIGDSASNETHDIIMAGGSTDASNSRRIVGSTYSNVDQSDPAGGTSEASNTGATSITIPNCLHEQGYGVFYSVIMGVNSRIVMTTPTPNGGGPGSPYYDIRCGQATGMTNEVGAAATSTFDELAGIVVALNASGTPSEALVEFSGIVNGFTNLTPNEPYYLSDTEGLISLTPGTTNVRVGKAISATELLITH